MLLLYRPNRRMGRLGCVRDRDRSVRERGIFLILRIRGGNSFVLLLVLSTSARHIAEGRHPHRSPTLDRK